MSTLWMLKVFDILMSSMFEGGGIAVLYGLATRPKPEIFIRVSLVSIFIL